MTVSVAAPTWESLLQTLVIVSGVSRKEIEGPTRVQRISRVRMTLCYLARVHTDLTLQEIGYRLGARNHTTIHYGAVEIKKRFEGHEPAVVTLVGNVCSLLNLPSEGVLPLCSTQTLEIVQRDPPVARVFCRLADGSEWELEGVMRKRC